MLYIGRRKAGWFRRLRSELFAKALFKLPAASLDSGRVAACQCEGRRIGDCKPRIGAGQGQARVRQQSEARTEKDRCYTSAQYLRKAESL